MMDRIKKLLEYLKSTRQFLTEDIWRADFSKLSRARSILYFQLQLLYLVAKGFFQDRLTVRASALAYATLLSIVPLLALSFSLLKAFGFHNRLAPTLTGFLSPLGDQAVNTIVPNVLTFVDNINVGVIGAVGLFFFLFSVFSIVNNIERAFNDIWRIKKARSIHRKIADYLSLFILGPLFLFIIFGMTASLQSNTVVQMINRIPGVEFLVNKSIPILTSWLAFLFIYMFVPNTRVHLRSAFFGAVLAGTIWQLSNWFFADFIVDSYQVGPKAVVYAGFATLPLFLIWLYIGWSIVLLGAKVTYTNQNLTTLAVERIHDKLSRDFYQILAIKIILYVSYCFDRDKNPPSLKDMSQLFETPNDIMTSVIDTLLDARLLYETDQDVIRYLPSKSLDSMTLLEVITRYNQHGDVPSYNHDEYHINTLTRELVQDYIKSMQKSDFNQSIKSLIKKLDKLD
ncbi:YihY family inner membrane protein [candidate division KSB1 bacterium]|nr:YihY family inner membrane protein [candidate division KSB1 bacterium]